MKRIILLLFAFAILNGCAEYSALVGPSYTVAKSGSVAQVGSSMAASYGLQKATGQNPSTFIKSLVRKNNREVFSIVILTYPSHYLSLYCQIIYVQFLVNMI